MYEHWLVGTPCKLGPFLLEGVRPRKLLKANPARSIHRGLSPLTCDLVPPPLVEIVPFYPQHREWPTDWENDNPRVQRTLEQLKQRFNYPLRVNDALLIMQGTRDADPTAEDPTDDNRQARGKRPAPRGTAAYPRKRAVTACQVCRSRRTKCDNLKPSCSFCLKTGAKCITSPVDLSSFDPASLRILERLDDLEQLLRTPASNQGGAPSESAREQVSIPQIEPVDRSFLFPKRLDVLIDELGFHGRPHLLSILRQRIDTNVSVSSPISISGELEPRESRLLLDNFFNYVHVKNPILREASTRRLVAQLCLHGVDWSPQSCLGLLVCALGAIATPFGDSESTFPGSTAYATAHSYFQAAQKRLGTCMVTSGVVEAQCLLLAGIYMMCIFRPADAWRLFLQSMACCQDFDFLSAQETDVNLEDPSSQSEQAIYWSSWKSHQELRGDIQPHDFILTDIERGLYPPFFPTPPSVMEDFTNDLDPTTAERERNGWYFYLAEISLRRLSSRLSHDVLQLQPLPPMDLIQTLADTLPARVAEVHQWIKALPLPMSLECPTSEDDVCRFVLRGHLINLWEMLYCPFLETYLQDIRSINDPTQHVQAKNHLRDPILKNLADIAVQNHMERISVNRPGFKHRHHGTWSMIRSCTRSALILASIALCLEEVKGSYDFQLLEMPNGWQSVVIEVIDLNRYWENESSDARERLPFLEEVLRSVEAL